MTNNNKKGKKGPKTPQQKWKPGSLLRCKWLPNGKQYKDGKDRYGLLLGWQDGKCLMLPLSTSNKDGDSDWLMPNGTTYTNKMGMLCWSKGSNGLTNPCSPTWDCGLLCEPESWWKKCGQLTDDQLTTLKQKKQLNSKQLQWQEGQPLMPSGK